MTRYILIDHSSGYIWGDTGDLDGPARKETPAEAAQRLDASLNEFERIYEEHGPNFRPLDDAYHVYQADIDGSEIVPLVVDGQDQETIEAVERACRKVAVVTFKWVYGDADGAREDAEERRYLERIGREK